MGLIDDGIEAAQEFRKLEARRALLGQRFVPTRDVRSDLADIMAEFLPRISRAAGAEAVYLDDADGTRTFYATTSRAMRKITRSWSFGDRSTRKEMRAVLPQVIAQARPARLLELRAARCEFHWTWALDTGWMAAEGRYDKSWSSMSDSVAMSARTAIVTYVETGMSYN